MRRMRGQNCSLLLLASVLHAASKTKRPLILSTGAEIVLARHIVRENATRTPFTLSTRREQYTGQRFTTHASSLSALGSLPRELLEPVVAVDDFFIFIVDVDGVVS